MTSDFKKAFCYDDAGYYQHEVSVQVVDGEPLMPPSVTFSCPWGKTTPSSTASTGKSGLLRRSRRAQPSVSDS